MACDKSLLAHFHHQRSGLIVLIVLVPEPSAAGRFARRLQHLADHERLELLGDTRDLFWRITLSDLVAISDDAEWSA